MKFCVIDRSYYFISSHTMDFVFGLILIKLIQNISMLRSLVC